MSEVVAGYPAVGPCLGGPETNGSAQVPADGAAVLCSWNPTGRHVLAAYPRLIAGFSARWPRSLNAR